MFVKVSNFNPFSLFRHVLVELYSYSAITLLLLFSYIILYHIYFNFFIFCSIFPIVSFLIFFFLTFNWRKYSMSVYFGYLLNFDQKTGKKDSITINTSNNYWHLSYSIWISCPSLLVWALLAPWKYLVRQELQLYFVASFC